MNDLSPHATEPEAAEPARDLVSVTLSGYRAMMRSAIDGYAEVNDSAMAYGRSLFELLLRPYSLAAEAATQAATRAPRNAPVPDEAVALVAPTSGDAVASGDAGVADASASAALDRAAAVGAAGAVAPGAPLVPSKAGAPKASDISRPNAPAAKSAPGQARRAKQKRRK